MSKKVKLSDHFYRCDINKNQFNYSLQPECSILVNNQKRKVYGKNKNKVYLNNDDYIQFNIFNPLYQRIGVQLEFNGNIEKNILIVNPGERVILDRFLDSKKRIKFSTYFIDGNNDISKKAIEKNGNVVIHFWYEKQNYNYISVHGLSYDGVRGIQGCKGPSGNTGITGSTGIGTNSSITTTSFTTNLSNTNMNNNLYESKIETGRIEKGEKSKQNMIKVDFDLNYIFKSLRFKLLPYSIKENKKKTILVNKKQNTLTINYNDTYKTNSQQYRIYCPNVNCGYRVRNRSWKFCPICSTQID